MNRDKKMRQIRFRVWDKTSKKMYYLEDPYYDINHGSIEFSFPQEFFDDARQYESEDNDFELMLWTDMVDRNNNPIYEGDILRCTEVGHPYYADVQYIGNGFWLRGERGSHLPHAEYREIVGNIWEHPNLLEGE